jgi:hypothetical protein
MKRTIVPGFVVTIILLIYSMSLAELSIIPRVTVREAYNDNIFLTETDEEDDFITTVEPGISLDYSPNNRFDLNIDYALKFRFYADHNELNDTSIRETQRTTLQAQARPLNHVFIDVTDYYRRVPVDIRNKVATDNDFENRTENNTFMISPYAVFPLTSTVSSRIGYRFINEWYKDDLGNNSDSHSAFLSLEKKFPTGLNTSIGYTYLAFRPELSDDYDKHEGSVSAEYQIASNFRVWGGAGIAYLDFSNRSNEDEPIWNVGSQYNMGILGGTTLTVTYSESLSDTDALDYSDKNDTIDRETALLQERESITSGVTKEKRFDFILSSGQYLMVTVNPYYAESQELETDRVDERTGVDVTIEKPLTAKLQAALEGYWETQEFSPANNEVDRYSLGGSLEYVLSRNITSTLGYRYNNRNSDTEGDDYDNNIVWVAATMTF